MFDIISAIKHLYVFNFVTSFIRNILEEVGDGVAEQLTEDGPFSLMTHTFGPEVFRSVLSFVTDTLRSSLPEQEGEQEAWEVLCVFKEVVCYE